MIFLPCMRVVGVACVARQPGHIAHVRRTELWTLTLSTSTRLVLAPFCWYKHRSWRSVRSRLRPRPMLQAVGDRSELRWPGGTSPDPRDGTAAADAVLNAWGSQRRPMKPANGAWFEDAAAALEAVRRIAKPSACDDCSMVAAPGKNRTDFRKQQPIPGEHSHKCGRWAFRLERADSATLSTYTPRMCTKPAFV